MTIFPNAVHILQSLVEGALSEVELPLKHGLAVLVAASWGRATAAVPVLT